MYIRFNQRLYILYLVKSKSTRAQILVTPYSFRQFMQYKSFILIQIVAVNIIAIYTILSNIIHITVSQAISIRLYLLLQYLLLVV